jgi:hypothetical protein
LVRTILSAKPVAFLNEEGFLQRGDGGLLLLGLIGLQLISQAGDAGGELLGLDAEVPEAGCWGGNGWNCCCWNWGLDG